MHTGGGTLNYREYEDFQKKFRTLHRDDMYHVIRENDRTGMFSGMINIFLMAFAIGFHNNVRVPVRGTGAINHANASAISQENQDLIIVLMLDRHGDISRDDLWSAVEEYAEGGIQTLFDSLKLSEWVLDIETIL